MPVRRESLDSVKARLVNLESKNLGQREESKRCCTHGTGEERKNTTIAKRRIESEKGGHGPPESRLHRQTVRLGLFVLGSLLEC
jgi:hypothetical protein